MNVLFLAPIYGKPDFADYFGRLARAFGRAGHQFFGLHIGSPSIFECGFRVDEIPFRASIHSFKSWDVEYLVEDERLNQEERDILSVAADFHEPADQDPRHKRIVTAVLANFLRFFTGYLKSEGVDMVILGHQFSGVYHVARHCCEKGGVSFVYNHPGVLPGTMEFERNGRLAESDVFLKREEFDSLPVDLSDLERARKYIRLYRENGSVFMLRPGKAAESSRLWLRRFEDAASSAHAAERNKILLVGGVDYRCGVSPASYPAHTLHSPWIRSNGHLLSELIALADDLKLSIFYKPHPAATEDLRILAGIPNLSLVRDVTLRDALKHMDALVSICSASAYEATLLGFPVIQCGRLAFNGRGFTEEAFSKRSLRESIVRLMTGSRLPSAEEEFVCHVARLIKYKLSSIQEDAAPGLGCGIDETVGRLVRHRSADLIEAEMGGRCLEN